MSLLQVLGQEHQDVRARPDLLLDLSEGNSPICGEFSRHVGEMLLFVMGIPGSAFLSAPSGLVCPLDGGEFLTAALPGKHRLLNLIL